MAHGQTKITRKNQVTLPVAELRKAGLEPNDVVVVTADGAGRIVIERYRSIIEEYAEKLSGNLAGGVEGFLEWRKREWEGRPVPTVVDASIVVAALEHQ